MSVTSTISRNT